MRQVQKWNKPSVCPKTFPNDVDTYLSKKVAFSPWLAALLLIPGSLIMLVLIVLIRVTSRGPAIYKQARVGRNGVDYIMYKLRTMPVGAESKSGPIWNSADDNRATPFGKVLRRLHLDELPQLINVIRGEMALVGPRPERPEIAEELIVHIPGYMDRYEVLPGITGLAQIHLPYDTELNCVRKKLIVDMHYIRTANLVTDLRVVACSFLRIIGIPGHLAARWVGLRLPPHIMRALNKIEGIPEAAPSKPSTIFTFTPPSNLDPISLAEFGEGQEPSPDFAGRTD